MRKLLSPPAIVFKGSGWAKKGRRVAPATAGADAKDGEGTTGGDAPGADGQSTAGKPVDAKADKGTTSGDKPAESKAARPSPAAGGAPRTSGADAD